METRRAKNSNDAFEIKEVPSKPHPPKFHWQSQLTTWWNCYKNKSSKDFSTKQMKKETDVKKARTLYDSKIRLGLFEPKVSRSKVDEIIVKLGFHHSHRIEARGFSRGIWIGWNDTTQIEIIQNPPQFILVKVRNGGQIEPILIVFVYRRPNPTKRKSSWEALKAAVPSDCTPWMALRDFNTILSVKDKNSTIGKGAHISKNSLNPKIFKTGIPRTLIYLATRRSLRKTRSRDRT
ncbi:hypothetical protein J1N35_035232 [Gossypium stocksii]|uniref:Endonuclease/exonuclease/phosphatase domain-containing protein n=1 Tax=Gossypium stocksii TaxID=47602 RepID=A0A9D3UTL5_9ROSI|nr:hypothetical protein J1N35_035232 [Gossypium stocksii]